MSYFGHFSYFIYNIYNVLAMFTSLNLSFFLHTMHTMDVQTSPSAFPAEFIQWHGLKRNGRLLSSGKTSATLSQHKKVGSKISMFCLQLCWNPLWWRSVFDFWEFATLSWPLLCIICNTGWDIRHFEWDWLWLV